MSYIIKAILEEQKEFTAFLQNEIKAFNNEHSFYHKVAREKGMVQPINILVTKDDDDWVGGLSGEVYWGWFELNYFWLYEEYRGKGLGTTLLGQAEKIAKDLGAKKALLKTFEFQARTFYESKGYEIVGEIKDYPPGSNFYTMVKIFV